MSLDSAVSPWLERAAVELDAGSPPARRTVGYLLRDAARLIRRRFIQRARETGLPLNHSEATVLTYLSHDQGVNQVTLAGHLDIEPITLARLLDRLQEAGLVERRLHPTDRRVRTVWLCEAAQEMLARIRAISAAVRDEAFQGFSPERREALIDELVCIRRNLVLAPEPRELKDEACKAAITETA